LQNVLIVQVGGFYASIETNLLGFDTQCDDHASDCFLNQRRSMRGWIHPK
jgi:hypothetical protein